MIWSTLEFPSFNFNSILDGFCILKRMLYMMPLSRHALSLQTGLHRRFILGTVIPPTLSSSAGVQGWRQGVAKSSELLVGPPYEEVGPQMGWSFPHHQSRLPCCHQAPTLCMRETCPPCCLRLQHLPLYP